MSRAAVVVVHGYSPPGQRLGRAGGRPAGGHVTLEGSELVRRVEAHLLAEQRAVLVGPAQRLALAPGTVQGDEEDPPRALSPRVLSGERLRLAGRPLVETQRQQRGQPCLAGVLAQLAQPRHLRLRPPLVGELGEGLALPLGQAASSASSAPTR